MRRAWTFATALFFASQWAAAATSTWVGNDSEFNQASNWTNGVPTDVALFDSMNSWGMVMSTDTALNAFQYTPQSGIHEIEAPQYGALTFLGNGVVNNSGRLQYLYVQEAGRLVFRNASVAGSSVTIKNVHVNPNGDFSQVEFHDTASADHATINNTDGTETIFYDGAQAGSATITNANAGTTIFHHTSHAGYATFINTPGTVLTNQVLGGGELQFRDSSNAEHAQISNLGNASGSYDGGATFHDSANAGYAQIANSHGGFTIFFDSADAGFATIDADNISFIQFQDGATANHAALSLAPGGELYFYNTATAAHAAINNRGWVTFGDNSDAGWSEIVNVSGLVTFGDRASGGHAAITLDRNSILDISSLTSSGMSIGSLAGDGQVVLGAKALSMGTNNRDAVWSGFISGNGGSLIKIGTGTLTLAGSSTYTGPTVLNEGALVVDAAGVTPSVTSVATVLGKGDLVVNGGTLRTPTQSFGVIPVAGNYTQHGGTLELKVGAAQAGQYDVLAVQGAAHLGGRLSLDFGPGYAPGTGQQLKIVQASSIDGTFDTIAGTAGLGFTLDQGADGLNLSIGQLAFAPYAITGNQRSVARYVDGFSTTATGDAATVIGSLNIVSAAAAPAALNALSPQRFEVYRDIAIKNGAFAREQLSGHFQYLRNGYGGFDVTGLAPHTANPYTEWADASVGQLDAPVRHDAKTSSDAKRWSAFLSGENTFVHQDATADLEASHFDSYGATGGLDYRVQDDVVLGVLFNYAHTRAVLDDEGGTAAVSAYVPGLYAAYVDHSVYASALVSGGPNTYTADRPINVGDLHRVAHSTADGHQMLEDLEGGIDWPVGHWTLGPTLGLQYMDAFVGHFTEENAGAAGLTVADQRTVSLQSRLGGRVTHDFAVRGWHCTAEGRAAWQHEYRDNGQPITAGFNQAGLGTFDVQTTSPQRNAALLGAGINTALSKTWTLGLNYDVRLGDSRTLAQRLQGNASMKF